MVWIKFSSWKAFKINHREHILEITYILFIVLIPMASATTALRLDYKVDGPQLPGKHITSPNPLLHTLE